MTVIPTISSRNTRAEAQPMAKCSSPSFKAYEMEKDSFVKRPKESWAHKYRDIIGFLAGGVVGDIIWHKVLLKKVESVKNLTGFKSTALYVGLNIVTGLIGSMIALKIGENK